MTNRDLDALVDQLSLQEQVTLLSGQDFWSVAPLPQHGIGRLRVTDGPNGARGRGSLVGGVKSAAFPIGISLGASWDPDLAREVGEALAKEVKSKGAHMLLAPTTNIHRSVTNGRNFECYSEEPELAAAITVGYVNGLQSNGIAATIKHFAGNESELERTTISSEIDERTLREVYLRPFEDAVKLANTWGIMSSYNKINGTYTAEHEWLLTDVLRGDWGFEGIVMSDWFGSRTTAETVNAGLDLEMPGPTRDRGDKLVKAVEDGDVSRDTIRTRARAMLNVMERTGVLDSTEERGEIAQDLPETRALIRKAAAAGTVLLSNDGILPLAAPKGSIAVLGPNAKEARIMGGGSAQLNPHYTVSPYEGLAARGLDLDYAQGVDNHRFEPLLKGDYTLEFFDNNTHEGPAVHTEAVEKLEFFWVPPFAGGKVDPRVFSARLTGTYTATASGLHHIGIICAGLTKLYVDDVLVVDAWTNWKKGQTFFEEGCDEVIGNIDLEEGKTYNIRAEFVSKPSDNLTHSALQIGLARPLGDADIAEAVRLASKAETAILFVGRTGEWDTEGWDFPSIKLPGRQDELISAVAAANPRTIVVLQSGGPVEMPWRDDVSAILQAWYGGQETGNAIADVLFGDVEPTGRLPQSFPVRQSDNPTQSQDPEVYPGLDGKVRYEEGVFIGYRHYDRAGIDPMFAFGFGLGYTTFEMGAVTVNEMTATVSVTNTGTRRGSTVVQAYVSPPKCPVDRPAKELRAFAKVTLDPGESRNVTLTFTPRDLAWFDVENRMWQVTAGDYIVHAGFSAVDLKSKATLAAGSASIAP